MLILAPVSINGLRTTGIWNLLLEISLLSNFLSAIVCMWLKHDWSVVYGRKSQRTSKKYCLTSKHWQLPYITKQGFEPRQCWKSFEFCLFSSTNGLVKVARYHKSLQVVEVTKVSGENHRLTPSNQQLSHLTWPGFKPRQWWDTVSSQWLHLTKLEHSAIRAGLPCLHIKLLN